MDANNPFLGRLAESLGFHLILENLKDLSLMNIKSIGIWEARLNDLFKRLAMNISHL